MINEGGAAPLGVEVVEWIWLKPHHERDALWLADSALDLAEVARAMAEDDAASVRLWLLEGRLAKPSPEQVASWNAEPLQKLRMVIVQPFVLAQELTLS